MSEGVERNIEESRKTLLDLYSGYLSTNLNLTLTGAIVLFADLQLLDPKFGIPSPAVWVVAAVLAFGMADRLRRARYWLRTIDILVHVSSTDSGIKDDFVPGLNHVVYRRTTDELGQTKIGRLIRWRLRQEESRIEKQRAES